jgi:hypothetical protein
VALLLLTFMLVFLLEQIVVLDSAIFVDICAAAPETRAEVAVAVLLALLALLAK